MIKSTINISHHVFNIGNIFLRIKTTEYYFFCGAGLDGATGTAGGATGPGGSTHAPGDTSANMVSESSSTSAPRRGEFDFFLALSKFCQ